MAAFGEIVVVFLKVADDDVGDDPLEERREGVKLGESTFSRLLLFVMSHKYSDIST